MDTFDKYKIILITIFFSILLAVYFKPRTLWDRLGLSNMDSNEIVYCTFLDISQGNNKDWSGTVSELWGQSNELFGALFHKVSISGPVLYKNGAINPDLANLYIALPCLSKRLGICSRLPPLLYEIVDMILVIYI